MTAAVAVVGAREGRTVRDRVSLARRRAVALLPADAEVVAVEVRRVGRWRIGATATTEQTCDAGAGRESGAGRKVPSRRTGSPAPPRLVREALDDPAG